MSVWSYCIGCGDPLPLPDLKDAVRGAQICSDCGREQRPLDTHTKDEIVGEILDRIEALELVVIEVIGKKPPWPRSKPEAMQTDDPDPL